MWKRRRCGRPKRNIYAPISPSSITHQGDPKEIFVVNFLPILALFLFFVISSLCKCISFFVSIFLVIRFIFVSIFRFPRFRAITVHVLFFSSNSILLVLNSISCWFCNSSNYQGGNEKKEEKKEEEDESLELPTSSCCQKANRISE